MKVYIAGPMTGLPDENFPAFFDAERRLNAAGYEAVNPAMLGHSTPERTREWFLKRDIPMLLECDAIALLPNWEYSIGATLEERIARVIGLQVLDAITLEVMP